MTIEERAKEYADRLKSAKIGDFGIATVYGYKDVYNANMAAYKKGATEQKAIDDAKWLKIKSSWEKEAQITHDDEANYKQGYHDAIEKACEIVRDIANEYFGDWEQSCKVEDTFRKAMGD